MPATLAVPPIDVPVYTDDGRRLHRFRQSSLKDVDICLERARLKMVGAMPRVESDSTAMGTSVHTGIELTLQAQIDDGVPLSVSRAVDAAQQHFTELMAEPDFKWNKTKEGGARAFIEHALRAFHREVLPTLQPREVEVAFGPLVLHEDDKRVIEIVGTADALCADGLKDWKTSLGREWEKWEVERWDLQSCVYVWAQYRATGAIEPFEFVVLRRKRLGEVEVQRIVVLRHLGHFDWLRERVIVLAKMIEADLDVWPLNDNSALCSPQYCEAWGACKGLHFADGWPKVDIPRGVTAAAT